MKESISVSGRFYITLMEEDRVVATTQSSNKILKSGNFFIANGGSLMQLRTIAVGSNGDDTVYTQTTLNSPLVQGIEPIYDGLPPLTEFQYGYMNYFPPGVGTGVWREIGAITNGGILFNRAIIDLIETNGTPTPITKGPNQAAYASVIFTISRTPND